AARRRGLRPADPDLSALCGRGRAFAPYLLAAQSEMPVLRGGNGRAHRALPRRDGALERRSLAERAGYADARERLRHLLRRSRYGGVAARRCGRLHPALAGWALAGRGLSPDGGVSAASARGQRKFLKIVPVFLFDLDLQRRQQADDADIVRNDVEEIDDALGIELLLQGGEGLVRKRRLARHLARRAQHR